MASQNDAGDSPLIRRQRRMSFRRTAFVRDYPATRTALIAGLRPRIQAA
jgi:hypothetical protein